MNIITRTLEENTISDGNMEGDLLFILHKLVTGKKLQIQKKRKNVKSRWKMQFFCATQQVESISEGTVCVKLHCFMGRTFVCCAFLGVVKLLYKIVPFCSFNMQNAHKDKMCPTLHWKKVLVFCVRCGKIISGFEVWLQFFQSRLSKDFFCFLYSWGQGKTLKKLL